MATTAESKQETTKQLPRVNRSAASIVALLTALGLAAGYARDAGLAAVYGASAVTDAFFVATLIPIFLGTILVAGALNPAVIPVLAPQDSSGAQESFNLVLTWTGIGLFILCALVAWQAVPLVHFLAPGVDPTRTVNAARLVMITAPAAWLMGIGTLLGAFANVRGSFAIPATVTWFVNGAMLLAVLLSANTNQLEWVGWGMVCGAAAFTVLQFLQLRWRGWRFRPRFARDAQATQVLRLFVPLLLFILLAQVVPIVERRLSAGFSEGNLSQVVYASKLYQIPATLVPGSFVIVLFPALVHILRVDRGVEFSDLLREGLRSIAFVMIPLAIGFFVTAPALVRVIFQRGEFSAADTAATAELLRYFSLAIVPGGWLLVLTRAFHARRDMTSPLWLGGVVTAFYIASARVLVDWIGLAGLPLALAFSQAFGAVGASSILARQLNVSPLNLLDGAILRILLAALPMLGLMSIGAFYLTAALETSPMWVVIAGWSILSLTGALIFWLSCFWLRVPEAVMLRDKIFRRVKIERGENL